MLRALAPRTVQQYGRMLERAFGRTTPPFGQVTRSVRDWPESCKAALRAAVARAHREDGSDGTWIDRALPATKTISRVLQIPSDEELAAYERAARGLPAGKRALALLPLAIGLRAEELLKLTRRAVQRALKTGELVVLGKGNREELVTVTKCLRLLEELLEAPRAPGRGIILMKGLAWSVAGEILSPKSYITQYHLLHRMIRQLGRKARLDVSLRPHMLRHAFVTKLARRGADAFDIQKAARHRSMQTTLRYVHLTHRDIEQFLNEY